MNRVDLERFDEEISDTVKDVDWHVVKQHDSARFGLAAGIFRDAMTSFDIKNVAWKLSSSNAVYAFVLAMIGFIFGLEPWHIIAAIVFGNAARAAWLGWLFYRSESLVLDAHRNAMDEAYDMAATYPKK